LTLGCVLFAGRRAGWLDLGFGPKVKAEPRQTILPPDLFRRYENDNFWDDPALNKRGVRIV